MQKEKEQLAAMDKQKEKLMASKFGSCDLYCVVMEIKISYSVTYPLLRSKKSWTNNSRDYCSATTEGHPCTNLLDGNMSSYSIA